MIIPDDGKVSEGRRDDQLVAGLWFGRTEARQRAGDRGTGK